MKPNAKYAAALIAAAVAVGLSVAAAKSKSPDIREDASGLPAELSENIARAAVAMGVKEPLAIAKAEQNAKVSGSNATVCTVKLSADAEPKMLGISCK
ncbi:hypothetical protein [Conchiformibius kuhniae]|uniref:DUF1161 domain-containing protein n=1 Tax=Conchiformibius kuhniae TaxID=211502 RepID=A0A8T9MSA0_9NEIS|nr:hypothetical protein [Conchiformibius kuhniae]UOP04770.1 hypothetical protein LVJ77_11525 [Conchiformibius kuhniae]